MKDSGKVFVVVVMIFQFIVGMFVAVFRIFMRMKMGMLMDMLVAMDEIAVGVSVTVAVLVAVAVLECYRVFDDENRGRGHDGQGDKELEGRFLMKQDETEGDAKKRGDGVPGPGFGSSQILLGFDIAVDA